MPRVPAAHASTSTSVVEFHSSVPSDSGASVGIVYAEALIASIGAATLFMPGSLVAASYAPPRLREKLLDRCTDDARAIRITLHQRLGELARLPERDVRRQRRHVGIGVDVEDRRSIARERLVPRAADVLRPIDADAAQADRFGVSRIRKIGNLLRCLVLGIALHYALLPGHLVEIAVVEHQDNERRVRPAAPVLADRDHFV